METIQVRVAWCDKNFGATIEDGRVPGSVVVTDKTWEGLQKAVAEALKFHIEGMLADGDSVPAWLAEGDYRLCYNLEVSALLRKCEQYTSLAAIARASGINRQQLSHYANGLKTPRARQRERIVEGIHKIGNEFLAIS